MPTVAARSRLRADRDADSCNDDTEIPGLYNLSNRLI